MTMPDGEQSNHDATEPEIQIAFKTEEGIFADGDDLPPEARSAFMHALRNTDMPEEVRAAFSKALGVDPDDLAEDTTGEGADGETGGPHGPDCACDPGEVHREQLWAILDTAFPNDPHLWSAGEALFALSAVNPAEPDDDTRRAALESASKHIEHLAGRLVPAMSPAEQMVADFRKQMGNL